MFTGWLKVISRHSQKALRRPETHLYSDKRRVSSVLTTTNAQRQTIYALSTPPGKGGVAIVRISGPDALQVWKRMVRPTMRKTSLEEPPAWKLHRCRIIHPESEFVIDDGLAVYFRAPYSYTTHPTIELHIHSGRALISALLSSLSALPTLRPAEPGEFTRQALLGGRLDLTQVEGLHDLIEADTEVQRVWALGGAGGETRAEYESLRTQIIGCLAQIEALIDFGEGEDIEEGVYDQARSQVVALLSQIQAHLSDNRRGELIRSGIRMAIFGPPNAGKSSLFNYLANRPASIVTPIPGTTRDVLELTLDIGGLPVIVADTAGLRETEDVVEGIGVQRGMEAVRNADISLCVLPMPEVLHSSQTATQKHQITLPESIRHLITPSTYFLFNKSDLIPNLHGYEDFTSSTAEFAAQTSKPCPPGPTHSHTVADNVTQNLDLSKRAWTASLTTGAGTHEFVQGLSKALKSRFDIHDPSTNQSKTHAPLITRARHRVHLESACKFLQAFLDLPPSDIVLAAEELRYAAQAVGRVTGDIGTEDVLDALFRDFCIGK
ncbi:tRNA modification GTPase TrmE [Crassisporium funariophilum]|nr:tRNA modification GTPase TrmE [Crassisporium funariophilum]